MRWVEVEGQLRAMRMLQMAYAGGRMPHAWLFYGPTGIGKQMLATRFARLLLCDRPMTLEAPAATTQERQGQWHDGCGQCKSCHLVEVGTHPDLHVVHRQLNKFHPDSTVQNRKALDISVEVVRHFLLDPIHGRSAMGKAKVYVIREAELLSTAAQNALLKTLEEPPEDTYIILLSTAKDRLLPTTISRCQPVPFGTLDVAATARIIAARGIAPADSMFYAALSEGRPGWALHLAKMDLRRDFAAIAEGLARIGAADPVQLGGDWYEVAQRWAKAIQEQDAEEDPTTDQSRHAVEVLLVVLSAILRDALRLGAAAAGQPSMEDSARSLESLARWPAGALSEGIKQTALAESAIDRNANVVLTLEALAVRLGECARGTIGQ